MALLGFLSRLCRHRKGETKRKRLWIKTTLRIALDDQEQEYRRCQWCCRKAWYIKSHLLQMEDIPWVIRSGDLLDSWLEHLHIRQQLQYILRSLQDHLWVKLGNDGKRVEYVIVSSSRPSLNTPAVISGWSRRQTSPLFPIVPERHCNALHAQSHNSDKYSHQQRQNLEPMLLAHTNSGYEAWTAFYCHQDDTTATIVSENLTTIRGESMSSCQSLVDTTIQFVVEPVDW